MSSTGNPLKYHDWQPRSEGHSGSRHGSSNSDRSDPEFVMRPASLSAKPPTGLSGSPRQSKGSRPVSGGSYQNQPPSGGFRPRDDSTGSRSSVPSRGGVNMRPDAGRSKAPGSNSASLQEVDLNLSGSSDQSVVKLGGVEYPIGSRIGKSKMFVIGDPGEFSKHNSSAVSYRSSAPSVSGSQVPMYRGDGKGYDFEYWPWPVIRFTCFIFVLLVMIGLLAGVITVAVQHKEQCEAHFLWWQGATSYNLPVPFFHDSDNSNIGDLLGVEKKISYFQHMGVESVILHHFLFSEIADWNLVSSFTAIDPRLGTDEDLTLMIQSLHEKKIKVVAQICPWYTSKEHGWYVESRESTILSPSTYRDFYVWQDAPSSETGVFWEFDSVRNQYYMYIDEATKPLLDWRNSQVIETFNGVLEFWLQKGIDGFYLCDLDKFFVERETDMLNILSKFHDTLNTYSQSSDSQKILIIDSVYVTLINNYLNVYLSSLLERIDLIKTPLVLVPENKTAGLESLINRNLQFENRTDNDRNTWILWSPAELKDLPALYIPALELLNLFIPGTPSLTAGQEIGQFYMEVDERYQAPMLWEADSPLPYNPGSPIPYHTLDALHNVSAHRQKTFALRQDRVPTEEERGLTIRFHEVDPERDFMLLSRFYPSDNTYYYVANFGNRDITRDFTESITPWATVLADTSNKYHGRLELDEVLLEPGQAVVFYPTK